MELVSLAYLWRRDQVELLQEMIDCGIHAIIIKTASLGLNPDQHLGQTLQEMQSHLMDSVSIDILELTVIFLRILFINLRDLIK